MNLFVVAVTMLALVATLSMLNNQASKKLGNAGLTHTMPMAYTVAAWFILIVAVVFPTVLLTSDGNMDNLPIILLVDVPVAAFAAYLLLLCNRHKVMVQEDTFTVVSAFGRKRTFKFEEVASADFNLFTYFIRVKNENGTKAYVYAHLKGILPFFKQVRKYSGVDITAIENALRAFRWNGNQ